MMKIAMFSANAYDRDHFELANAQFGYKVDYFDVRLDLKTCRLAHGYPVVCALVNDDLGRDVLSELARSEERRVGKECRL